MEVLWKVEEEVLPLEVLVVVGQQDVVVDDAVVAFRVGVAVSNESIQENT